MTRSVKVNLEADVGKYIPPVIASTEATEKLDDKIQATNRDLDKTPAAAARAAAAMKLLGGDAKGVGNQLNDLGPNATNSLELIDQKLISTRAEIKKFADDFNKTGSSDSFNLWQSATKDLKGLERLKKDLTSALEDGAKEGEKAISGALQTGGQEGSKSLSASLQGALSTPVLGPIVLGALVGAVAVSAPAIGAAIGSAFIGGTGLGLIGLGIAGQINSAPVQSAFGVLKQHATDDLTAASSVFQSTLVGGLHTLTNELDHIAPDVQRNLSKIAIPAQHLFGGITDAIDRLGPGIDDLSSAAAPFIDQLATELPKFAGSLSQMFHDISSGAPGAILFLHDLFTVLDATVVGLGKFVDGMEHAYSWLRVISTGLAHGPLAGGDLARELAGVSGAQDAASQSAKELKVNMEVAGASLDLAGGKAMSASDQFGGLISALNATNNTADKVAGAMSDKLLNTLLGLDHATLGVAESQTQLSETLDKNGRAIDKHTGTIALNTKAGQDNREAILNVVEANIRQYDANIAAGDSAQDAAAKYDVNTAALEKQLHQAGYTQAQIDGLIGKYKQVPDNVNTAIALEGLTQAINDLADLERAINHIPSYKKVTVEEEHRTSGSNTGFVGHATGAIRRAAFGMIVPPRDPGTLIGEPQTGGEALIPLQGISQTRAAELGQVAMSGYGLDVVPRGYRAGPMSSGGGALRVELAFIGGNDALSSLLMKMQRTGDIQITATRV
jgi:hypothetical protein